MLSGSEPTIKEALDASADAIKNGDIDTGKAGLKWVLERDPDNVLAWLWMSRCTEIPAEKLECFNRVLALDPTNKHALEGIKKYGDEDKKDDAPSSPRVSSAIPLVQDSTQRTGRVPRWIAIGGTIVAAALLIGVIAVVVGSVLVNPEEEIAAYMVAVEPILQEWDDAVAIADSTPRMSLPDRVSELQDVRRRANNLQFENPDIAEAHLKLVSAMDYGIDAFLSFLAQDSDGEVTAAFDRYHSAIGRWEKDLEVFAAGGDG